MKLPVATLPSITFVGNSGGRVLDLASSGRQIAALREIVEARFPDADRIGILFRSGAELVLYWLAVLASGKSPLILSYPTTKLNNAYWRSQLVDAIADVGIGGVICGPETARRLDGLSPVLVHDGPVSPGRHPCESLTPGSVLQMSSGTTGVRKAIEFTWDALATHVTIYDEAMQLTAGDRVVSWLPLYHDMGFIAAFAMPLLRGVPIVMIDPMDWVADPGILFRAVRDHRATICYMPNFGFEAMSRHRCRPEDLASMRLWISCSEPTYRPSVERFCKATGTSTDRIAVCYAMAENIFALTQRSGLRVQRRGDQEFVSCGPPLPRTELKLVGDLIWARSPTSISSYVNAGATIDADGFYATGDIGFIEDGELFIEGRQHDLLVQAGRKFFLNDFDYLLNETDPSCRGRGAALALRDETLGTERLVIVVEREEFYDRPAAAELRGKLAEALPIENWELALVPPGFITKTSSGKVNRQKTAADLSLVRHTPRGRGAVGSFAERLQDLLPLRDLRSPVRAIVDSLGLVVVGLLADEYSARFDPDMSIEELLAAVPQAGPVPDAETEEVVAIVSCMDWGEADFRLTEAELDELSAVLDVRVTYEHVCLPPVHFLWQDIVFRDFFLPRQPSEKFSSYLNSLARFEHASVLFFDDIVEKHLECCAFPVMDRGFRRAPIADLLALRAQRYGLQHHELPIGDAVLGASVTEIQREAAFQAIRQYFDVPIFRAAHWAVSAAETRSWEYADFERDGLAERHRRFVAAAAAFLRANLAVLPRRRHPRHAPRAVHEEIIHFCSFVVNPALIEQTVQRFDTLIIQGLSNSLPYLAKRIDQLGKRAVYVPVLQPDGSLGRLDIELGNACVVQTGAWRDCVTDLPVVKMMEGDGADYKNLPPDLSFATPPGGDFNTFRYVLAPDIVDWLKRAPAETYPRFSYAPPSGAGTPEVEFLGYYRSHQLFRIGERFTALPRTTGVEAPAALADPSSLSADSEEALVQLLARRQEAPASPPALALPRQAMVPVASEPRAPRAKPRRDSLAAHDDRSVSCLMVTRDRYPLSWLAVESFRRQTYEARELVIIDGGADRRLGDAVAALGNPAVRLHRPADRSISLGAMRNLAVAHARGRYICTWDDDDLYDPQRLEWQMRALTAKRVPVSLLLNWLVWWPAASHLAVMSGVPLCPSLVCEKEQLITYPDLPRTEDTPVVEDLLNRFKPGWVFTPQTYIYVAHGRNTCPDGSFDEFWTKAKMRLDGEAYHAAIERLSARLPLAAYQEALGAWQGTNPVTPAQPMLASEKAKMLSGRAYRGGDPELAADRRAAEDLLAQYNMTTGRDAEMRSALLRKLFARIEEDTTIEPRLSCEYGYNIHIGARTFINGDCVFLDSAPIEIGDRVQIGPKVQLYTASHPFDQQERGEGLTIARPIRIGDAAWIGGGAIVLPGITIGEGSIVGAGSVVTKDVAPHTVVAGNPARLIRSLG